MENITYEDLKKLIFINNHFLNNKTDMFKALDYLNRMAKCVPSGYDFEAIKNDIEHLYNVDLENDYNTEQIFLNENGIFMLVYTTINLIDKSFKFKDAKIPQQRISELINLIDKSLDENNKPDFEKYSKEYAYLKSEFIMK